MRSNSILHGVNVPIAPSANTEAKLTNNITISAVAYPGSIEQTKPETNPYENGVLSPRHEMSDPKGQDETTRDIKEESRKTKIDEFLLHLYETILLSDNKKLISNIIFKESIVLTQEDLCKVIELQTGKKCEIKYEDPEISCCGVNSVFMKISSIRILEGEASTSYADYKIKYNPEYLELMTTYHLNLKYVLING